MSSVTGDELEGLTECRACNRLAANEDWLMDAQEKALRRGLTVREVVEFALWWFHDERHPRGDWRPTGFSDLPAVCIT
jgi:triphosphoribosyl-dephospho-CoA synthetase